MSLWNLFYIKPSCRCSLNWKGRFREKIFQTRRITSTAGSNLVYPVRHGLPSTTLTVDIPVTSDSRGGRLTGWWMLPTNYTGYTILYLHGISNSRAYYHRLGLYKVFLGLGYRVLAVDYRGFADSSSVSVTETTLLEDALVCVAWIRNKIDGRDRLIIWGHSLGAAVACRAMNSLEASEPQRELVDTLVLESPFNNLLEEIQTVVFNSRGALGQWLGSLLPVETVLDWSDHWIKDLETYTLILHAEDDKTIPIDLAKKLFRSCYDRGKQNIHMTKFSSDLKLGHNHIYRFCDLDKVLKNHIERNQVT